MKIKSINALAEHLSLSRLGGDPTTLPPKTLQPMTLAEGYQVQQAVHDRLTAKGFGQLIGHKIGCTTKVMQDFLSIEHPCSGEIFESTVYQRTATLNLSDFHRIGVECEIAARLSTDLSESSAPYDGINIKDSVGSLMAAIELVDDRYVDYPSFPTPTLIADDFFNAGVILGEEYTDWTSIDLLKVEGIMLIDDIEIGRGVGSDIFGDPMQALAWLANHSISLGNPLKSGTFIMLGSVVKTFFVEKPSQITISFKHLGEASVQFF